MFRPFRFWCFNHGTERSSASASHVLGIITGSFPFAVGLNRPTSNTSHPIA